MSQPSGTLPVLRYSLHQIQDDSQLPFDPHGYSRFKFGDERHAQRMGSELADGFAQTHLDNISKEGLAVAVCYESVPTAAYFLRKHFIIQLNEHLAANGMPLCQEAHIKRTATFYQDFGKMSAAQRVNSLDKDDFQLATPVSPSKTLIYLDDIRVTGTHERKMLSILQRQQIPNQIWVVYFAEVLDTNIDPILENTLNYYAFPTHEEIAKVPRCGHFNLNARFTKHLLNQSNEVFTAFLRSQQSWFWEQLAQAVEADRWDKKHSFSENLETLAMLLAGGESISGPTTTAGGEYGVRLDHSYTAEQLANSSSTSQ